MERVKQDQLGEAIDQLLHNLTNNLNDDTQELVTNFKSAFKKISYGYNGRKPNVLVAGVTGAGKSTLINKVFGQNVAATGTGAPVTQHFTCYKSQKKNVVIYDSKGLEVGEHLNFIKDTKEFIRTHPNQIDVCWYIVNSATSRFQGFEGEVCQQVFNSIPIIFVLNKADISSNSDRQLLKETILNLNLDNCVAIVETVSSQTLEILNIPDICPQCGSDDLDIRKKRKIIECEDCGTIYPLVTNNGLDNLVMMTANILPDVAKDNFVAAQQISIHQKNIAARESIYDFKLSLDIQNREHRIQQIIQLLVKLSNIWGFRINSLKSNTDDSIYDTIFSALDSISRSKYNIDDDLAISIVWNQAVSSLYREIFKESFGTLTQIITDQQLQEDLPDLTVKAFSILTPEKIKYYKSNIKRHDFKKVLDVEMPEEIENDKICSMDDIPLSIRSNSCRLCSFNPNKEKPATNPKGRNQ